MFSVEFYPHTCVVKRESGYDENGMPTFDQVYSGACCLTQGSFKVSGNIMQGEQVLQIPDIDPIFNVGDSIEVVLENGATYEASIENAYPIKDDDFGGQEISLMHSSEQ